MGHLISRKLFGAVAAMLSIVGLIVGAFITVPTIVTTDVLMEAIAAIVLLGGYQIMKQAGND
ncbi:hypothetical protein LCGC14_0581710 [marine sediment metagenome]|uniref:Uncharacterized protein n=1 Tax=marine sediment metagenome TaxID=412755 RepID=A0A0F9U2D6_9ZZZZ